MNFKPSFKKIVKKVYKAASKSVDFQNEAAEVSNQVNRWAKKKTNGLIEEIFRPGIVDEMTRLIFANAENGVRSLMLQKPKTMNFISSMEDAHDGLQALLDKITSEPGFLNRQGQSKWESFLSPTFEFEASNVLEGLGLTLPFSPGGFTKMSRRYFTSPSLR
ncbi:hypothetical protein CQW23_10899 [Capsicum baccatum]|uniref:Serpin domain-containing protein n=1 Tax=Capsicum baccatum TaxID=33114 RepID=A0A2G2X0Y6_CAPBA|nr:hypothetical protein CQW23_10899 [Capsicum baccatum]